MPAPDSDTILARLLALHPKIIDLTLERVHRLLADLGHPERALAPVIHIAGTNGKGSVQAMIRSGLAAEGLRVQAYTSPHLAHFHERIRLIDGLIGEGALAALLAECETVNAGRAITFFEITTVAALLGFARERADYTVLEVGLGGRLDATNVIDRPALTAITPVSLDHQQYLGETVAEIAGEKAGILKPGVPCVVGPQSDAALEVIEARAEAVGAPLIVHGRDWIVRREHGRMVFQDNDGLLDLDPPRLIGTHQIENAGIAVASLRALGRSEAAMAGVAKAEWPARMQRLHRGPLLERLPEGAELWLDGGHNAAAGQALASIFAEIGGRAPAPLWLIAGMLETKAVENFFRPLAPLVKGVATVSIPDTAAAIPADVLASRISATGIEAEASESTEQALQVILQRHTHAPLRIVICGSLYLAGAILREHA
ncbi:MAG: folylpolyglutamate synthase/dihydrofolate synthase family protein [Pseudomonadota bacterium]